MKALVFTWNTGGLRLCETSSQGRADRSRYEALFPRATCVAPDFFEVIRDIVQRRRPEIIAVSTSDEPATQSYFHSEFLPKIFGDIGYQLWSRETLHTVGDVASGLQQANASTSTLRCSLYLYATVQPAFKAGREQLRQYVPQSVATYRSTEHKRALGAIAIYLYHPTLGLLCFVALDFPDLPNPFTQANETHQESYREFILASNQLALLELMHQFYFLPPVRINQQLVDARPNYFFLSGTFNYLLRLEGWSNTQLVENVVPNFEAYREYDEFNTVKDKAPLKSLVEGIDNQGPAFAPTWKLARGRVEECSENNLLGCYDASLNQPYGLGWSDRILNTPNSSCEFYSRMDLGNMHQSTHAGVMGLYTLLSNNPAALE